MKSPRFLPVFGLAIICCAAAPLQAAEAMKIEAVLYLFTSKSVPNIDFRKALRGQPSISGEGIVVTPPAMIDFDQEMLALDGANYAWNGGQKVPSRFYETILPGIVTPAGRSAMIRVDVPVQYLEKMPDGSLQVREIPRDSTEAPRYQLTLNAEPVTVAPPGYDLKVTCQMDISTLQGREKISGVDLDVGRPITSRFDGKIEYWARKGEWFALMTGQKESGDYTLLMLLKVSPVAPAANTLFVPPSKPGPPAPPAAFSLAAGLAVSANGVTELWLGLDRRSRAAWPPTRSNPGVRFGLKLRGAGPVYRKFEVRRHGAETSSVPHEGTVTIDPKQQWVVIDLQEVVSKPGEPRRTEPCEANGRYPVEEVDTGANAYPQVDQRGAGPSASELAVPVVPNGPYVQPK